MRGVEQGKKLAKKHGKILIVEEVGFQGPRKASEIAALTKSVRPASSQSRCSLLLRATLCG